MLEKALQRDTNDRVFEKDIRRFGEMVLGDPGLLAKLDSAPNKETFVDMYCLLARERGINFSKDNLLIAVQEQKQGSNWIIPKKILRMIADRF